jgi:hypothetical protein
MKAMIDPREFPSSLPTLKPEAAVPPADTPPEPMQGEAYPGVPIPLSPEAEAALAAHRSRPGWWGCGEKVRVLATTAVATAVFLVASAARQETGSSDAPKPAHLTAFGEAVHDEVLSMATDGKFDYGRYTFERKNYDTFVYSKQYNQIGDDVMSAMLNKGERNTDRDKAGRDCFLAVIQRNTRNTPFDSIVVAKIAENVPSKVLDLGLKNYKEENYDEAQFACSKAAGLAYIQNPYVKTAGNKSGQSEARKLCGKPCDDRTIIIYTRKLAEPK